MLHRECKRGVFEIGKSLPVNHLSAKLYTIDVVPLEPVQGLKFEKASTGQERKFFVMATTCSRIYQFIGSIFLSSFAKK